MFPLLDPRWSQLLHILVLVKVEPLLRTIDDTLAKTNGGIALGKIEVRAENYRRLGIYISCRLLQKWDLWAFGAIAKDQFTDNNIGPGKPSMTSGGWSITNGKSLGWKNSSCWYTPLQSIHIYICICIYVYFIRYTNRLPQIPPNFLGHGYPPGVFLHFRLRFPMTIPWPSHVRARHLLPRALLCCAFRRPKVASPAISWTWSKPKAWCHRWTGKNEEIL